MTVELREQHGSSYLCKEEDKVSCSSDLVQDTLQALGFSGEQTPERVGLQGHTLYLLGAKRTLGDHRLGLALQSDHRLIDGVDSGTARGIHHRQTFLYRQEHKTNDHFQTFKDTTDSMDLVLGLIQSAKIFSPSIQSSLHILNPELKTNHVKVTLQPTKK